MVELPVDCAGSCTGAEWWPDEDFLPSATALSEVERPHKFSGTRSLLPGSHTVRFPSRGTAGCGAWRVSQVEQQLMAEARFSLGAVLSTWFLEGCFFAALSRGDAEVGICTTHGAPPHRAPSPRCISVHC